MNQDTYVFKIIIPADDLVVAGGGPGGTGAEI